MSPQCPFAKKRLTSKAKPDPCRQRQPRAPDGDHGSILFGPIGLAQIEAELGKELEANVSHAGPGTRGEDRSTPRVRCVLPDDALRGTPFEPRDPGAAAQPEPTGKMGPTASNAQKCSPRCQRAADAAERSRCACVGHLTVGADLPSRAK